MADVNRNIGSTHQIHVHELAGYRSGYRRGRRGSFPIISAFQTCTSNSNPTVSAKTKQRRRRCFVLAETEKGIRTRKGIGVKRNGPVERFVADWASRPKGEAQAGGCGASV